MECKPVKVHFATHDKVMSGSSLESKTGIEQLLLFCTSTATKDQLAVVVKQGGKY